MNTPFNRPVCATKHLFELFMDFLLTLRFSTGKLSNRPYDDGASQYPVEGIMHMHQFWATEYFTIFLAFQAALALLSLQPLYLG